MGVYFIVNPIAGGGRAKEFIKKAEPILRAKGLPFTIGYTQYPRHAEELARQVDYNTYSKVVSVGGDGTLNEVINGLDLERGVLGVIPAGSGNDLIKSLDVPEDPFQALEGVLAGREQRIDLGYVNQKRFINVAGIGLDVEVLLETERLRKVIKGKIAYILGVFKALINFKGNEVELVIDNRVFRENLMLCAIGNGQFIGGGMRILPDADLEDGLLDVCLVKKMPKLRLLYFFPRVFKGAHIGLPEVVLVRGSQVTIKKPDQPLINVDGEILQGTTPTFRLDHRALRILVSKA